MKSLSGHCILVVTDTAVAGLLSDRWAVAVPSSVTYVSCMDTAYVKEVSPPPKQPKKKGTGNPPFWVPETFGEYCIHIETSNILERFGF